MPAMDFDEAKHDSALQEAAEMEQVLQGKKVVLGSHTSLP